MKSVLRRIRVSQPLNLLATSATRAVLGAFGVESDFVVKHVHRAGVVRCKLPNGRSLALWSRADDWVSNQLYWRGLRGYEPETVGVFMKYAAAARVTIDVGAYVGFFSLLAAHVNPAARVYAFEPHPNAYARLVHNVRLNRVTNVECIPAAAGAQDASGTLWAVPGGLPTSSSVSHRFMAGVGRLQEIPITVQRLDSFVGRFGLKTVDFVKVDTESTEPDVLSGCQRTLEAYRPAIVCEVLPGRDTGRRLEELLGPLGYRYFLLADSGPQRSTRIEGHAKWLNYLFVCGNPV